MSRPASLLAAAGAALAVALGASAPATAKPVPACAAPASGYRACLHATWDVEHHRAAVSRVRARVALVERVARCRAHGSRRVTAYHGAKRLGSRRATATCAHGVVRWDTTFTRTDSAGWALHKGDVVRTTWGGTDAAATIALVRR
jgi:hypothetical protein